MRNFLLRNALIIENRFIRPLYVYCIVNYSMALSVASVIISVSIISIAYHIYYENGGYKYFMIGDMTMIIGGVVLYIRSVMKDRRVLLSEPGERSSIGKGAILDWLLPPGEVDHRTIELEEGRDRWTEKYGPKRAEWLYVWQSLITVVLFWFDRVVVKLLVRRS